METIAHLSADEANEAGVEGSVKHATFLLNEQIFMCMDSNAAHGFTFTPSISLYVACNTEKKLMICLQSFQTEGRYLCLFQITLSVKNLDGLR